MDDCLFCKIVRKEIKSEIIYENDDVICFNDISPSAPTHVLIVPKKHYNNIMELNDDGEEGRRINTAVFDAISEVARICKVNDDGFRVINNCGTDGGQTVNHIHYHLLGGKKLNPKLQ